MEWFVASITAPSTLVDGIRAEDHSELLDQADALTKSGHYVGGTVIVGGRARDDAPTPLRPFGLDLEVPAGTRLGHDAHMQIERPRARDVPMDSWILTLDMCDRSEESDCE